MLTQEQFIGDLRRFIAASEQIGDLWKLEQTQGQIYMTKTVSQQLSCLHTASLQDQECFEDDQCIDFPDSCLRTEEVHQVYRCDYHILYSTSYSVPVVYFNFYKSDGQILDLETVWSSVPSFYQSRLKSEKWTFITQQEHPYLGRPYYQLHPCHTADMMAAAAAKLHHNPGEYLLQWLSSVAPVIHLQLSLAYGKLIINSSENLSMPHDGAGDT